MSSSAGPKNEMSLSKRLLTEAPILAFPHFDLHASPFILQTDASAGRLGAILQQNGHVIAYASHVLNKAECNYSVIQWECLAAVYGMKQFRHYLLGRPFEHWTDHEPLKWLVIQKLEVHGRSGIAIVRSPCNHQSAEAPLRRYSQLWAH